LPEVHNPNLQSQGPGGSGGGDSRTFMAFMMLMLAVILGYQLFFAKPKTDQQPPAQTQSQAASPAVPPATGSSSSAAPAPQPTVTPQISAALETDTTVENEFYRIVFSNRGAQVKHWILKKYFDSSGKPLDMVQAQASAQFGLPLAFFTYSSSVTSQLNQALYQITVTGTQPSATGLVLAPTSITFHYAANGLEAVKTLKFDMSYVVTVQTQVKQNGSPIRALIEWPAGLGDMEELQQSSLYRGAVPTPSYFAWSLDGHHDSLAAPKVSGNATFDAPYQYAAIMDLYFASAFMPDAPDRATVVTLHNTIDLPGNPGDQNSKKTSVQVLGLAVGDISGDTSLRLFVGPKQMDLLKSIHSTGSGGKLDGPTLEPLIEFGWLTIIAKPLYFALRFLRDSLGHGAYNWGWAIIIFTAVFNLLMLPTRISMMKQSLKMQRIQPKLDAIKNRYKHLKMNDPKRADMNAEMMALHKAEGVNPVGGCLPMLLQLPLFSAYYYVLARAVELRQAGWFWLRDLSAADPYYILPGIIILTMFLTQYITPSPGMDPAQRRMMAIVMPIFMGFMFGHLASGLALYMSTSGVINMVMQIAINQSNMGKEMHAHAARRAAKRAGLTAKTFQGRR
jgi:YidC/Oxa1 family membrane protein insertase